MNMALLQHIPSARAAVKTTATVLAVTVVVAKLLRLLGLGQKRLKPPPGPWGLPLVGYLPFFGKAPPVTFTGMRKKYGDVIGITMGSWPAVVICGLDVIKDALLSKGDDFSGRPAFASSSLIHEGRNLAFGEFSDGWKRQRKIVRNVLHTYSHARKVPLEDIVHAEMDTVVQELLAGAGMNSGVVQPHKTLTVAACSVMYQLCYGHHHSVRDNGDFMQLLTGKDVFQEFAAAGNVLDVMPWLRFFMGKAQIRQLLAFAQTFYTLRDRKIGEHEETFSQDHLRDIADGLIHAGNRLTEEDRASGLHKQRLLESLDPLLDAGTDTASTTLLWTIQLLATHPQLQEDIVTQIHSVVGHSRKPALADRENLPLVEAVVLEVLRYVSVQPFALPHQTTRNTTLRGYDIPAGTVVLVNLHSIHRDEQLWGDPHVFRPHRFLDSSGKLDRGLAEKVTVFSLGPRRCPGETVARMELFLFLATLLQAVRFSQPADHPGYDEEGLWELTHNPSPFSVAVEARL